MNLSFLDNAIIVDFAMKLVVCAILFLAYLETKNKLFIWWSLGWLFFGFHAFLEHALLYNGNIHTWFLRHLIWALAAVFFLYGVCRVLMKKKKRRIYLAVLILFSFLAAFTGTYIYKNWFLSALSTSMINGPALILSAYYFYKTAIDKKALYNQLIILGFILNGFHNLDYPFLRNVVWFAPFGFVLCAVFTFIFAIGMIMKSASELRRGRKIDLEHIHELATLYSVTSAVCRSRRLQDMLYSVLDAITRVIGIEAGMIYLMEQNPSKLVLKAHHGLSKRFIDRISLESTEGTLISKAADEKRVIILPDVLKSKSSFKKEYEEEKLQSCVCVPLTSGDKILGVLVVSSRVKGRKFSAHDLRLLDSIGDELSIAIDNRQLYDNLERLYLSTMITLTDIVEAKDRYTRKHSDAVARYAVMIAKELKLSDKQVEKVKMASQLHDLGKIGISDFILLKKGRLTEQEWEEIKKHPQKAVDMLQPLTFLHEDDGILEYIRSHHERFDGKGYPNGFKEKQIKMGARILAIADAYHAMISSRPYRKKALTQERAIKELKKNAGLQFDPKVVNAFLKVLEGMEKSKD